MRSEVLILNGLVRVGKGVVSGAQLAEHFSQHAIRNFERSGRLVRVHRFVFIGAGCSLTPKVRLRAAVLAAGPGAYASHRSASRLWNFGIPFRDDPEITVPRGRMVVIPGVRVHTSNLGSQFVTKVDGIPVTTPERTLLEISSMRGDQTVRKLLEDVVIRHVVDMDRLRLTYELTRAQGRRRFSVWTRLMPELFPDMKKMATRSEVRAYRAWQIAGLPLPTPQYGMFIADEKRYLDFAYPEFKIDIECDGYLTHDRLRAKRDKRTDRWLETRGWLVLRFPNDAPDWEFVDDVRRALLERAA